MIVQHKDIIDYYDSCETHYKTHWNLNKSLSIHYGYWDKSTSNLHEALLKINDVMAEKANINSGDYILDAGCGVGGSAVYLAKHYGCKILGISLSEKQIFSAQNNALSKQVVGLVHFEVNNFCQTGYKDETFDVVWAIESVCHANQKSDFIQEAFRLLKPGGRLILADFFVVDKRFNKREAYIIQQWASGWAVPDFDNIPHFVQSLKHTGFRNINIDNISPNIMPSARRLFTRFFPGWLYAKTYHLLFKTAPLTMDNVWTAYWQYIGLRKNLWDYYLVYAQKPD